MPGGAHRPRVAGGLGALRCAQGERPQPRLLLACQQGIEAKCRADPLMLTRKCGCQQPERPVLLAHPNHASGDMLASCGGDRTVRIWRRQPTSSQQPAEQPQTPQQAEQQPAEQQHQRQQQQQQEDRWVCSAILEDTHSRTIRSVCWSPTGRFLATASFDRTTAIWQHQVGEALRGAWWGAVNQQG